MAIVRPETAARPLTPIQWLICIIAAIGFAFDSYELLMLPLIVRPALADLLGAPPNSLAVNDWVGTLQYVPAVAGGIFGLLGGYLTDLFGRRRVLVWSILLYAFSAMAAGYATSVGWLLFWRCCTFVGVCVEFVAAVAWLSELFSDPKQRERVVGYTQAFGSIGGLMVTGAYYLIVTYGQSFPEVRGGHEAWRYTLISGVIPALPLILIRPFLPESPTWREKKAAGTLRRPSFAALFAPEFRRTTIVTTVMMACAFAAAFGAIQQMPRIVPGLPDVQQMEQTAQEQTISGVQSFQEFGGLAGRLLLAYLAAVIISRRRLLWLFQIPGLIVLPIVYLLTPSVGLPLAQWGIFIVGMATIAQFSFWGNYLPRVYPTHLRGTGESFAANVGGRMIGTMAALVTVQLVSAMPGGSVPIRLAYASALVGTAAYVIGVAASYWLPEPQRQELPGRRVGRALPLPYTVMTQILAASVAIAALSTLADFVWATWIDRPTVVHGLVHGLLLFGAIGLVFGVLAGRPRAGAARRPAIGALGALSYYLISPLAGVSAMFLSWFIIWLALAVLYARLSATGAPDIVVLTRGLMAATASGLAFYAISGIWMPFDPQGWDYAVHFAAWTAAYFPGFAALLTARRR